MDDWDDIDNNWEQQTIKELAQNALNYVKYNSKIIALTNANVFDGNGNSAKTNQTLIFVNGYFQSIGQNSVIDIPKNATIINLIGKTIIPGIMGINNHLHIPHFPFIGVEASKLYLASGVTTIKTCGSASPDKEIELSEKPKTVNLLALTL